MALTDKVDMQENAASHAVDNGGTSNNDLTANANTSTFSVSAGSGSGSLPRAFSFAAGSPSIVFGSVIQLLNYLPWTLEIFYQVNSESDNNALLGDNGDGDGG